MLFEKIIILIIYIKTYKVKLWSKNVCYLSSKLTIIIDNKRFIYLKISGVSSFKISFRLPKAGIKCQTKNADILQENFCTFQNFLFIFKNEI